METDAVISTVCSDEGGSAAVGAGGLGCSWTLGAAVSTGAADGVGAAEGVGAKAGVGAGVPEADFLFLLDKPGVLRVDMLASQRHDTWVANSYTRGLQGHGDQAQHNTFCMQDFDN